MFQFDWHEKKTFELTQECLSSLTLLNFEKKMPLCQINRRLSAVMCKSHPFFYFEIKKNIFLPKYKKNGSTHSLKIHYALLKRKKENYRFSPRYKGIMTVIPTENGIRSQVHIPTKPVVFSFIQCPWKSHKLLRTREDLQ